MNLDTLWQYDQAETDDNKVNEFIRGKIIKETTACLK